MTHQPRKMSEVLKEMSEQLLRNPATVPSATAVQFGLMLANFAWNETVGLGGPREGYRSAWETIEADNPEVWSELESNDVDAMIDELVRYKKKYYPDDDRRILSCGFIDGKVRVDWLAAAAPGVDSQWEMRLYGLVRSGQREKAVKFVQETLCLSRNEAASKVAAAAAQLGIG
jgi:hypothetical protein